MNESPLGWLLVGIFISAVGGGMLAVDDVPLILAVTVLAIGGLLTQICTLAVAVEWGLQRHAHKTRSVAAS